MNFDFALILTCTIQPNNMPNLTRSDPNLRLQDYKKSFNFWISNSNIKKIIFIENSGYDLKYFHEIAKNSKIEIEIISNKLNETYDKNLGKGYGQYLCLKEIFDKSSVAKKTNYFIDVTGRHCVKNFNQIISHLINDNSDIYINLSNKLKFADTNIYGGTKEFFTQYFIPEVSKTNDSKNKIFEHCAAKAVLKAIASDMKLSNTPIYADIDGFIGTNGKEYKQNIFKKVKLFLYRRFKNYILNHKKY
jgi:hypothetical protein